MRPSAIRSKAKHADTHTNGHLDTAEPFDEIVAAHRDDPSQFTYGYNAAGDITSWTQQSGASSAPYQYSYDNADRLLSAVTATSGTQSPIDAYAYRYDPAGNRTIQQIGAAVTTSTYNNLNQLTGQGGGGTLTISGYLSHSGTVTVAGSSSVTTGSANTFTALAPVTTGANNIAISAINLSGTGATTKTLHVTVTSGSPISQLQYDANGSLIYDGTRTYQWDAANRLIKIWYGTIGASASTTMSYDGMGRRVQILETGSNGTITNAKNLVWEGTSIAEEKNASDTITKRYFTQGVQLGGTNYYYTRDHLGSIRELTGATGAVQASYTYDPYGQQTQLSGTMAADFGYTGDYSHQPSGLCLTQYRQYSALLGRWLSRDPLDNAEMKQGPNLYYYVFNRPISGSDPLGLAYFASCPLSALGRIWLGWLSENPIDHHFDTELSHEQLFFEDGKQPPNIGFGPNGMFTDSATGKYHRRDGGYSNCIMRKAAAAVVWQGSSYCVIGHNCQSWADAVRAKYSDLEQDPTVKKDCCNKK